MKTISQHINVVERMLDLDEQNKRKDPRYPGKFVLFEVESIKAILNIAKALDGVLNLMNRLITHEEED